MTLSVDISYRLMCGYISLMNVFDMTLVQGVGR